MSGRPARATCSVVVVTLNEEERIERCLSSVAWADEIVVVDAESRDRTTELARRFTEHVYIRPWHGFADQKNFALDLARSAWVLSLDADEEVTAELAEELRAVLSAPAADGYMVARQNIFWGRWIRHGGLYPDWQVRLFRRGQGRFVGRSVHESVRVDGRVDRLRGALRHESYRDVSDFLERTNRYTSLAAEDIVARGHSIGLRELLGAPLGRFLGMYLLKRGFLDGRRGLLLAVLYAYYVFVRSAKAWERTRP